MMDHDLVLEILAALASEDVEYVVVGGVALNLNGLPRATADIDLLVSPDADNIRRLKIALDSVFHDPEIEQISAEDLAGGMMTIRKLTSLDEAEDACWRDLDSPGLWRAIVAVWEFSRRVAPQRFPPGVYRSRTIEEANRRVEQ